MDQAFKESDRSFFPTQPKVDVGWTSSRQILDSARGLDTHGIQRISQRHLEYLHYVLNSPSVPLACAFFVTLGLFSVDCMQRGWRSPLLVAPLLLAIFTAISLYVSKERTKPQPIMLQILATIPLVYIVITEFVIGYRSNLHTTAILHLQPPFLAVVLARNVREAAVYLGAHAMLVVNTPIADLRIATSAILMNDLILLVAAWVKGELAWIAAALCENYDALADYVADLTQCDKQDAIKRIAQLGRSKNDSLHLPRAEEAVIAMEAGAITQSHKLSVADLDTFEKAWILKLQEPPFQQIAHACSLGWIENDVGPWLVHKWACAEVQLEELRDQVHQHLAVLSAPGNA